VFERFEDIEVWKRGCRIAIEVIQITKSGLMEREWGLRDQVRRSAFSIASNIAEGYERNSQKEFRRFLLIAKGSCAELRTQLYVLQAAELLNPEDCHRLVEETKEISSMLQGLVSSIKTRSD